MADTTIVTKKTAAKPAATSAAIPAKPPVAKKAVTKKAVEPTANPTPSAPETPPAKPTAPKVAAAASKVRADKGGTQDTVGTKRAKGTKPSPQAPLEEKLVSLQDLANVTAEQRLDMIREAAYYKAEKRDFAEGHEADDWQAAEAEIDDLLAKARKIYGG